MSTASLRAMTLPCLAKLVSNCGLGAAARSGGLPAPTREVRIASSSLVDSYSTLIPVWSVKGLRTAMKLACSCPDQTAMTWTVPLFEEDPVPQATATRIAMTGTTTRALKLKARILKSPSDTRRKATAPLIHEPFYVPPCIWQAHASACAELLRSCLRSLPDHLLGFRRGAAHHQASPEWRWRID